MNNRYKLLCSGFLILFMVACAPQSTTLETEMVIPAIATSDAEKTPIHIEVPSDADVADIPWLIAIDTLKEKGYILEPLSFSETAIEVAAMAQGDLDISSMNNQVAWAAIEKGAPIATFLDKTTNVNMAMVSEEIQSCTDLDGKPIAVPGITSISTVMLNSYVEKNCPEVEPQIMPLSGGSNRLAALMAGEVSGAITDVDDMLKLDKESPGKFHPLVVFADEFPGLQQDSSLFRREFAEQNPEVVKDIIRAVFEARENIQDPKVLEAALIKYLEMKPEEAQKAAEVYLAQHVWDTDFLFTLEVVKANLEFLQQNGDLSIELTPEKIADLSFYDAVVQEFKSK